MKILVDTSIWSLALRKKDLTGEEKKIVNRLAKAIRELEIELIGPIRQEILSGIKEKPGFEELKTKIGVFKDRAIDTEDYELAAEYYNECRSHGIQGSHIDYLICAVAVNNKLKIMTLDKDFESYKKYIPIKMDKIA
jgi:predicted nucleic acid-binding protein